jgi:hypothetical protein
MDPAIVTALVGGGAVIFGIRAWLRKLRFDKLMAKYDDVDVVRSLMRKQFWEGMTEAQLLDSLGEPVDTDTKILKKKSSETWKYHKTGKNRFRLRVFVEDRLVVGWKKRS